MAKMTGILNSYLAQYFLVTNGEFHPVLQPLLPSGDKVTLAMQLARCQVLLVAFFEIWTKPDWVAVSRSGGILAWLVMGGSPSPLCCGNGHRRALVNPTSEVFCILVFLHPLAITSTNLVDLGHYVHSRTKQYLRAVEPSRATCPPIKENNPK